MNYEKPAKIVNWIQRLTTLATLMLVLLFFFLRQEKTTARLVLFLLWFAYAAYSTVKMTSELVGGQRLREARFVEMLGRWEEEQGSRKKALTAFAGVTAVSAAVKLVIPFLLWLV